MVAVTISPSEDEDTYEYHFNQIKEWLKFLYDFQLDLKFHISDGSLAIRNAIEREWKNCLKMYVFFSYLVKGTKQN